jgi:CRP-like cAMP-binding protein
MDEVQVYINEITPFSAESWKNFRSVFRAQNLNKGDYLATAGGIEKKIFILSKGIIRAFYRNGEGQEYNKTFFTGLSFAAAYSSLLTGQVNKINLQCLSDCQLLEASYSSLTALYDENREIERLARKLAEQFFVLKEKREIELVTLDAGDRYDIFKAEHPHLEQLIPQYHVASYLGITPTQLSRIRAR